jgi:NAD(P)-dependent dehydrogenase (short-subunit alcohol dehydrogenase family)
MRVEQLSFSREEMARFRQASHDVNPLHVSELYARKSPFGEPVVYGALAALACLGRLERRGSQTLARLTVEFRDALAVDTPYQLEIDENEQAATLTLRDGRRTLLLASAAFRAGAPLPADQRPLPPPRREPADRSATDLPPDLTAQGSYAPAEPAFGQLLRAYGLPERGLGSTEAAALCLASFLVGMELPGQRALFSRLLFEPAAGGAPQIDYQAKLLMFDARFQLLRARVELTGEGRSLGQLTLESFLRDDLPAPAPPVRSERWLGKTALVVGGSRGLGAAVARALAWQGGQVFTTYVKSQAEALALAEGVAGAPGRIVPVAADAGDLADCRRLRETLPGGALDLLVCSAFPAVRALWIEETAADRIVRFVGDSVRLVTNPLATFLPALARAGGQVALVSSIWAESAPADFPHYVAAKLAVEGLVRVAAREYPAVGFLITRPPRLRTDMTNTPLGRQRTLPPEAAAAVIVERLGGAVAPGAVEVLDAFGG